MGDFPDRAIPFPGTSIFEHGKWRKGKEAGPEYVRSDLYDAALAERDALRAQVEELTARRDRLNDFVRFVSLWCNREDPPNGNHKLTNEERVMVIRYHPVTMTVMNAAIDAAMSKLR